MSSPLESENFKSLYLGDENDDDATVLESYFTRASDGPPAPMVVPIPDQSVNPPIVKNRLISGYQLIVPSWTAPTQIAWDDEFRIMAMIKAISSTATDGLSFGDSNNSLTSPDGASLPKNAARIFPADGWVNLGPYTGALWVTAITASGNVGVTWAFITK